VRLATWNCCRGPRAEKLARAATLRADVVALQELGGDAADPLWIGANPRQGVSVISGEGFPLTLLPRSAEAGLYALPVRVGGASPFNLIAVWAQRIGDSYVLSVQRILDAYQQLIAAGPTVLLGDLNAGAPWDRKRPSPKNYAHLEARLAELGLVSAYHAHFGEIPGQETRATYYFQWHRERPFHIDYCFVPREWMPHVSRVQVGDFDSWSAWSDHRPLVVDVDFPG
jgi:hypothetical protein